MDEKPKLTEDEKEELVYRLWEEFASSIKAPLDDERRFVFFAGARSAIYELTVLESRLRGSNPPLAIEDWIEREFAGHGVAVRAKTDSPIPGEPLMSMEVAKDLVRRSVTEAEKWKTKTP
jgi:hypothetical protein